MKKKPAARAADPKPCESCGHCPTCGHSPREVVKVVPVPVPMPYPVPAPQPVYPWGHQPLRTSRRPYIGTPVVYTGGPGAGGVYRNGVAAQPLGTLMNCN